MEDLIETLAENTHNVWAGARIKDGFTYGVSDVSHDKIFCIQKVRIRDKI